jgi:hypothetical protein
MITRIATNTAVIIHSRDVERIELCDLTNPANAEDKRYGINIVFYKKISELYVYKNYEYCDYVFKKAKESLDKGGAFYMPIENLVD